MSLHFQVLGGPGRDNAVFVRVDSGQKVSRLLFDCGEHCLAHLSIAEIQAIDHVLFSHFHMDHISGFDAFFRVTYDRTTRQNTVWGPPGASQVMQHRFQGFLWNLYHDLASQWDVHDIYPDRVEVTRYQANEAFSRAYPLASSPYREVIIDTPEYSICAYHMDHQTPSMAYLMREKPRINVDTTRLEELGLRPGEWLKNLKTPQANEAPSIEIDGTAYPLADLRRELLTETAGDSLAYLTDFILNQQAQERLAKILQGCQVMICESQYRQADWELAQRNYHMTASQVAETARLAQVQQLILFHLSDRYDKQEWAALLEEAQAIFPKTAFPDGWLI